MALVIKRLLHGHSMPSDIVTEFPWLDTGKLASFYEQDRGIEGEFLLSWDLIEERYNDLGNITMFPVPRVLDVIAQMRKKGYDRTLRAGQSLHTLIVSRSRRYGLIKNQPWIAFGFHPNSIDLLIKIDKEEKLTVPKIEFTPQIDAQLKRLVACEIN